MKLRSTLASFAVTACLLGLSGISASAAEVGGSDSEEDFGDAGYQVVYGGQTQSGDPSAYDYVGAPVTEPTVTPRSAVGVQTIGGFSYSVKGVTFSVPTTALSHSIKGSGTHIDSEFAVYSALISTVCNWRVDYQNRYGSTIYSTRTNGTHWGCQVWDSKDKEIKNFNVKHGAQCARLFVNGVFRGEQCHNV